jgi:hypothetical protein
VSLDRRRQDVDVMERVLGVEDDYRPHGAVVELGPRPSFGDEVRAAVQVSIVDRGTRRDDLERHD